MLSAGAPVDYEAGASLVPLARAVMQRHTQMVHYLIEQGADVNKTFPVCCGDKQNASVALEQASLMSSVWSCTDNDIVSRPVSTAVLQALLDAGADVRYKNSAGVTALHCLLARPAACVEAIELLVQRGAELDACDCLGRTPLLFALTENCGAAPPLQQMRADNAAGGIASSMQCSSAAVIELLLEGGADLHARCLDGTTALCAAVMSDNAAAVAVLLNAGSNVNHAAADGLVPLHRVKSLAVLNLLLTSGADVTACSPQGCNALHWACIHKPAASAAVVCGLIKAGVDLTATALCQSAAQAAAGAARARAVRLTPAQLAAVRGHTLLAQLLARAEKDIRAKSNKSQCSDSSDGRSGSSGSTSTLE
jgi:ankyrin repeat protein